MKTINRISLDSVSSVCSRMKFSEMASCWGGGKNYSVDAMVHSHTKNGFNGATDEEFPCFMRYFLLLMFCISIPLYGQPTAAKISQLREGFHSQYIRQEKVKALDSCDNFYLFKEEEGSLNDAQKLRIPYNALLHQVEGSQLPPSRFVVIQDKMIGSQSTSGSLFWAGFLEDEDSKDNACLSRKLQKKYGCIQLEYGQILVPAKWYTGVLQVLASPFAYGGHMVSGQGFSYEVKEGMICSTPKGDLCESHFTYHDAERVASTLCSMQKDGKIEFRLDGKSDEKANELSSRRGLYIFSTMVNSQINQDFLPADMECTLPVMLYLDSWKHVHLYALSDKLSTYENLLLTLLSTAMSSQTVSLFQPYWCEDGEFPFIFLEAKLRNRKWTFVDYRFKLVP